MVKAQRPFNNRPNSKFSSYHDEIIRFSTSVSIDKLQLSLKDNSHSRLDLDRLNSMFKYLRPVRDGRKIIQEFRHNQSLIEFIWWVRCGFNDYAVIVHDPGFGLQNLMLQTMQMYPMSLSQVEVAFDFHPPSIASKVVVRLILFNIKVMGFVSAPGPWNWIGPGKR